MNREDQELISNYTDTGDQVWLAKLFQKYEHLIYGVCLRYTGDTEWSKDIKTQIYEKLVIKANGLKSLSFKNWLFTFCKNYCLDELRKKSRRVSALDKFRKFQINTQEGVHFGAEKRLIKEQDENQLNQAMVTAADSLSDQQKICMDLFFFKRYSYLEIGQETGMDIGQIKSHLQNGKRKMKIYLTQHLDTKA